MIMLPILAGLGALAYMSNPRRRRKRRRRNPDSEQTELGMYIVNDYDLYRRQAQPIIVNLAKKMHKGVYDHTKALKLWGYLADAGAQKYTKEFGSPGGTSYGIFTKADRVGVSPDLAKHYGDEIYAMLEKLRSGVKAKNLLTNPRRRKRRR